jgi:hypothetical protein
MSTDTDAPVGTTAAPTPATPTAPAATPPAPGADVAPDPENPWESVLIVASPKAMPKNSRRKVIVVQTSAREAPEGEDTYRNRTETPPLKQLSYPAGADAYLRMGYEADFGDNQPVITIGLDYEQGGFQGLSERANILNVGPASPIFAAVDLAITKKGAKKIEIVGASEAEVEMLKPYFVDIADRAEISFG